MKNSDIRTLKGPDRVRLRPAVIFGSEGTNGVICMTRMLLDAFVTEAVLGYCTDISIVIHKDEAISICSRDRGLIIDETVIDGKPAWYYDFCEIYAEPREPDEAHFFSYDSKHNDLFGKPGDPLPKYQADTDLSFDLCCIQYASEYMHVSSVRDGVEKRLSFSKGYSVGNVEKRSVDSAPYTLFRFRPDPNVFTDIRIPYDAACAFLKETALTVPKTRCKITDERSGKSDIFFYPNGIVDYVSGTPFVKEIEATGKDRYNKREYTAKTSLVFGLAEKAEITCFHNYRILHLGGKHIDAVKEKLERLLNREFHDVQKALSFEDIEEHIYLFLITNCTKYASNWQSGARLSIANQMITDMAVDLLDDDFRHYLRQNREAFLKILSK